MTGAADAPMPLPQGIPTMDAYARVVASSELAAMRAFSSAFAARYADVVPSDPLEQWSRRWEYPFALEALRAHSASVGTAGVYRVLDAGSGFTFFPFLLAEWLPASVTCVDASPALESAFRRAAGEPGAVRFRRGDAAATGALSPSPFDAVVCISVLEHVAAGDRERVLAELRRLLRPGGLLVVTFDVALDGDYPIPLGEAEALLKALARVFPGADGSSTALREALRGDVLTSRKISANEPWRMPWSGPLVATLGSLRHAFLPRSFGYRSLTVWCGRLERETPGSARPPSGVDAE